MHSDILFRQHSFLPYYSGLQHFSLHSSSRQSSSSPPEDSRKREEERRRREYRRRSRQAPGGLHHLMIPRLHSLWRSTTAERVCRRRLSSIQNRQPPRRDTPAAPRNKSSAELPCPNQGCFCGCG